MYIRRIEIQNIRSIDYFEMTFPEGQEAGWHVLIGDNGSGKSTIVRAIALGLLDISDIFASGENWNEYLSSNTPVGGTGKVDIDLIHMATSNGKANNRITFDRQYYGTQPKADILEVIFRGHKSYSRVTATATTTQYPTPTPTPIPAPLNPTQEYWFSAAYGPFRRFTGGNEAKEKKAYKDRPKLGAHVSVFGEDIALSEALNYIQNLYSRKLEFEFSKRSDRQSDADTYDSLISFINNAQLLPHQTRISHTDTDGVYFKDGNGNEISALQLSDGYRSIISLIFELIRQLINVYSSELVFNDIRAGGTKINLPGVVLIDEVDAHLHPTWQNRIGEWFTKHFPNIQFIVTTHSPLICRAAEKGSIWKLPVPGSGEKARPIVGTERDRLIYGNVSEAFGTGVFGEDEEVSQSVHGQQMGERLAYLNMKAFKGTISDAEKKELYSLKAKLPTAG